MIADRLVDKGSEFVSFDEESRFTDKGSEFVEYAAVHAPKGGVTIKGQFYPGGEFIPGHVLEGMDEVERAKAGVPKPVGSLAKEMKDKDKTDQQAQVGDPSNIADVMEWDIDPDRPWQEQLDKMRVPMVPFDIPQLGLRAGDSIHKLENGWQNQKLSPKLKARIVLANSKMFHDAVSGMTAEEKEVANDIFKNGWQVAYVDDNDELQSTKSFSESVDIRLKQKQSQEDERRARLAKVKTPKGRFGTARKWSEWLGASEDRLHAIIKWTGDEGGHFEIRDCFTKGGKCTDPVAKQLDEIVEKAPKFKGRVWRGLAFDSEEKRTAFMKQLEGKSFSWRAPSSASKDKSVGEHFTTHEGFGVRIEMKMKEKAADLTKISEKDVLEGFDSEDEVIVSRNAKFKVVSIKGEEVKLEEI